MGVTMIGTADRGTGAGAPGQVFTVRQVADAAAALGMTLTQLMRLSAEVRATAA